MPIQGQIVQRYGPAVLVRPPMLRAGPGRMPAMIDADPAPVLLGIAAQLRADIGVSVVVVALGGPGAILSPRLPRQWPRVLADWAALHVTTIAALEGRLSSAECVLAAVMDFRVADMTTIMNGYCTGPHAECHHPRLSEMCAQARAGALSPHAPILAGEALDAGIVDAVVEPGEAVDESLRWAQRSAGWPAASRTMAKLAINGHALRRTSADDPGRVACKLAGCAA